MGSGYVVEHCVSAFQKKQEERLYKGYVTESLMALTVNTTGLTKNSKTMNTRFVELAGWVDVDTRTGDEIAMDIINRAGLRAKE